MAKGTRMNGIFLIVLFCLLIFSCSLLSDIEDITYNDDSSGDADGDGDGDADGDADGDVD